MLHDIWIYIYIFIHINSKTFIQVYRETYVYTDLHNCYIQTTQTKNKVSQKSVFNLRRASHTWTQQTQTQKIMIAFTQGSVFSYYYAESSKTPWPQSRFTHAHAYASSSHTCTQQTQTQKIMISFIQGSASSYYESSKASWSQSRFTSAHAARHTTSSHTWTQETQTQKIMIVFIQGLLLGWVFEGTLTSIEIHACSRAR